MLTNETFTPIAPVQLVSPNGRVKGYGLGATTDAHRGDSLLTAQDAADLGDTIQISGNATIETPIGKDGVNWTFAPGSTITRSDAALGFIISDEGSEMSFSVSGHGSFIRTFATGSPLTPANRAGVLNVSHANSDIKVNFNEMRCILPSDGPLGAYAAINMVAGHLTFMGHRLVVKNDRLLSNVQDGITGIWWDNGELNGSLLESVDESTSPNLVLSHIYSNVEDDPTGDMRLFIERLSSPTPNGSDAGYYGAGSSNPTSAAWLICHTIQGKVKPGGEKSYITAQKIFSDVVQGAGGKMYLHANKVTGQLTVGAGTSWVTIDEFEPSGTSPIRCINVNDGVHYFTGQEITAATGRDAIRVQNGVFNLMAGNITTDIGSKDLVQTGGTLNVWPSVKYDATKTTGTITRAAVFGNEYGRRIVTVLVSDPNGDAITTGDGKAYYRVPAVLNGYNLVGVAASVDTVSSSGLPTVQLRRKRSGSDVDMLSTKLSLDASETDSSTAATAAVIDTSNDDVATADRIYVDIDVAGTGAKGLAVEMTFQLP